MPNAKVLSQGRGFTCIHDVSTFHAGDENKRKKNFTLPFRGAP